MLQEQNEKNIFIETLKWICIKLESAGIPYMITGGSAVGFWGHIRATMAIDIVINIYSHANEKIESFLQSIKDEAYVDIEESKKAVFNKNMFNVIFYDKLNLEYIQKWIRELCLENEYNSVIA